MQSCEANLLQNTAFKRAKKSLRLLTPTPQMPAASELGTRTSTKRKTPKVEEIDPAISTKNVKPSSKKLIKTVTKKTTAKKLRVIKAIPDTLIKEVKPMVEELDDASTLSTLMKNVSQQRQVLGGIIKAQQALEAEDRQISQGHEEAMQFVAAIEAKNKAEETERKRL